MVVVAVARERRDEDEEDEDEDEDEIDRRRPWQVAAVSNSATPMARTPRRYDGPGLSGGLGAWSAWSRRISLGWLVLVQSLAWI